MNFGPQRRLRCLAGALAGLPFDLVACGGGAAPATEPVAASPAASAAGSNGGQAKPAGSVSAAALGAGPSLQSIVDAANKEGQICAYSLACDRLPAS